MSVVHAEPRPRERSASMNDQSVGITEPHRLACQNTDVRSACAPDAEAVGATGDDRHAQHRHLVQVVAQVEHAPRDALLPLGGAVDVVLGRVGARPVDELLHRVAVELGDGQLAFRVVDADEPVRLGVRAVGCVHRDVEAPLDHVALDRPFEVEAQPHRRRRHQQLVGVVHDEVALEQLLVGGERAPVLPHAVDQAVVVEAEEEAVDVGVVAPAEGRGGVVVLAEHVRAVGDGVHVVEARGGEVVAVDLASAHRRG